MSAPLYVAFASGALTYDCAPCGKCCRGLGIADDLVHLAGSPALTRLAPWVAGSGPAGNLATFFTYADGCRHLGAANRCELHAAGGPQAKPRICRLFPFSKLADVGGMWALLPHESCPWRARGAEPDPLSAHTGVLADLDPELLAALEPAIRHPLTALDPEARCELERSIRDAIDLDAPPRAAIAEMGAIQGERLGALPPLPDVALWLDLLRSAGAPRELSAPNARLFAAALPALRIELADLLLQQEIPAALGALELWLRCLFAELGDRPLGGEDLMRLTAHARPLLEVLARAEQPVPPIRGEPDDALASELAERQGEPLGETLLRLLRPLERGAIPMMLHAGGLIARAYTV